MTVVDGKKPTYEQLETENAALRKRSEELGKRIAELEKLVEELRRRGKRQASPFSKGPPVEEPKTPGRKCGANYGKRGSRRPPPVVQETYEVSCPDRCPKCDGNVEHVDVASQFQTDIPPATPINRRFDVHVGRCARCGKKVRGRHELQTSDAFGAAGVQIGPEAVALAAWLNKSFGLSWEKVALLFKTKFGIDASRSTWCRATVERVAGKCVSASTELARLMPASLCIYIDETGYRIGGRKVWLWVFVTRDAVAYRIGDRSAKMLADTIGLNYPFFVCHDGWSAYDALKHAIHQPCLAHPLRDAKELVEASQGSEAAFPAAVKKMLKDAISLGKRREEMSGHGFATARGLLSKRRDELLATEQSDPANERLRNYCLNRGKENLLTFLTYPEMGIEPTNWPAEQAIRPAVIIRKLSGGNRTPAGAAAQAALMTVIGTCRKRGLDVLELFPRVLRAGRELLMSELRPPSAHA